MKILLLNSSLVGEYIQNDPILPRCPGMIKKFGDNVYPLGMLYIASLLRKNLHEVAYQEINLTKIAFLLDYLKTFVPEVIIFNSCQSNFEIDKFFVKLIRIRIISPIKFIVTGIFPSYFPELYLRNNFHFVINGEPEFTVLELITNFSNHKIHETQSSIQGLIYLDKNNQIVFNFKRELIQNLDILPFPALDLVDLKKYSLPYAHNQFAIIMSSRGCPYNCSFCSVAGFYGRTVRFRSSQNINDEILYDYNSFNIKEFHFWDDTLTIKRSHIEAIRKIFLEIRKLGIKMEYSLAARVDHIPNLEFLQNLKKSGAYLIKFGIESGDPRVLQQIHKQIRLDQATQAINLSKQAGLQVLTYYILGFPQDTVISIKRTIEFALSSKSDLIIFNYAIPWVGSQLYDDEKEMIKNIPISSFSGKIPLISVKDISKIQLKWLLITAYLRFFLTPHFLISQLKSIHNISKILKVVESVKKFLRFIV